MGGADQHPLCLHCLKAAQQNVEIHVLAIAGPVLNKMFECGLIP